jgi:hypothetical protein
MSVKLTNTLQLLLNSDRCEEGLYTKTNRFEFAHLCVSRLRFIEKKSFLQQLYAKMNKFCMEYTFTFFEIIKQKWIFRRNIPYIQNLWTHIFHILLGGIFHLHQPRMFYFIVSGYDCVSFTKWISRNSERTQESELLWCVCVCARACVRACVYIYFPHDVYIWDHLRKERGRTLLFF